MDGKKREWQYVLNHFKIVTKLSESGLNDIEEFSDTSQENLHSQNESINETIDILIFNILEVLLKLIPTIFSK